MNKKASLLLIIFLMAVPISASPPDDDDIIIEEHTLLATQYQALESSVLEDGTEYYLKVSGMYGVADYSVHADAAFSYRFNDDGDPYRVWVWNDLNSQRPMPDEPNEDHIYYFYFTGDGTSEEFGFIDNGGYGDNSGSLTIQIWEVVDIDLSDWPNQITYQIDTHENDLNNYELKIQVEFQAEMSSDYSDLLFRSEQGSILPHYIESYDNSSATIWVKSGALSGAGENLITIYYGNDSYQSENNPFSVFSLYENFDNNSFYNDWTINTQSGASYSFENGSLKLNVTQSDKFISIDSPQEFDLQNGYVFSLSINAQSNRGHFITGFGDGNSKGRMNNGGYGQNNGFGLIVNHDSGAQISYSNAPYGSGFDLSQGEQIFGGFHEITIEKYSDEVLYAYFDDVLDGSTTESDLLNTESHPFYIWANGWDNNNKSYWIDELTVRQYSYPEPSISEYNLPPVYGCTDSEATNYNEDANVDDGSCEYDDTNYSLSFDGVDDYVDLENKPITGTQNQFSILAYFKTNSLSINQGIYFHGGGYKDVGLRIDEKDDDYELHFFILTSAGSQGHTYAPVGTIDTGAWHHAAGTYDGQDIKLYVDGNLIIETAFSADVNWDEGTQFGPSIGGGNSQCPTFDGNIDEMSFWTATLSQSEIQSYMSTSPTGNETGLVGYWNFNNGSGTTLTDQTSNSNDGTISGASWSTDVPVESGPVLAGTWKMAPEAGALMVGPSPNDGSWWSNSAYDVYTRACYFDDDYVFNADGSFNNVPGDETWLEYWQHLSDTNGDGSVDYDDDHCGAPVYPHDGSNAATWEYDGGAGTVTLNGVGAYLALPKANNEGELTEEDVDVPESITYNITLSDDNNIMTLAIEAGTGVFWTFKLVPATTPTVIHVPADYSTIQGGIDAASNGDIVYVAGGTYVENINYNGKNISIIGEDKETTIIDGNQSGSVVIFNNSEGLTALLSGFSIINGNSDFGGGILCNQSSPIIEDCIISGNTAGGGGGIGCKNNSNPVITACTIENNEATLNDLGGGGGGINCGAGSSPTLTNLTIRSNTAEWGGGGILIYDNSNPTITDVTIADNATSEVDGYGGGIAIEEFCSPLLTNVAIIGNTAYYGGGCNFYVSANATLINVTISNNSAELYGGLSCSGSSASLVNCILWNNTD
ncbi:MAG TPA: DUF2341 domain-containing protein, partial [Candidatus Marinimicrobia bacterium]|nr:DUF2341 domain-containing protein [Candidatus Neomarinimicrobiota bacterium]